MIRIHAAAAAIATTPLARHENFVRCREAIERARSSGATLLCLPELVLTGYGCEDAFHTPSVLRGALESLEALIPSTHGMVVSVGLPLFHRRALYNVAALLVDGHLAGFAAKRHLAGDGVHYEPRWIKPWPSGVVAEVEVAQRRVPIGDLLFEIGGIRIGFEICEDAWVAHRPGVDLARRGVDVVLNPSASHFAFGKSLVRERFVAEGSRAFAASYVYANLVGNESGRVIYDGDTLIAEGGSIVARGSRLGYQKVLVTAGTIDIERSRIDAMRTVSSSTRPDDLPGTVRIPFAWPREVPARPRDEPAPTAMPKELELARAVALGLFGYLEKTRANGFVLGLSGGVDSAAIACLVRLMVRFAVMDLGLDGFRRALAHVPGLAEAEDEAAMMRLLLTTMYQSAEGSSEATRVAARTVAAALSAKHLELDLSLIVAEYVAKVGAAVERELAWSTDDIALQNIQARSRAPSVWLVANLEGKLLLTTSNRSEAALGYATMDGDTAGGLAPIAGIDKAYLRKWLVWLEQEGPAGLGPIPALGAVNARPSSPELRPGETIQESEQDLMPFAVIDVVERLLVRDRLSPREAVARLVEILPSVGEREAKRHVAKFARLFAQNQWKRERYAPSFHLDDENLDPKTWFRFPILSQGLLAVSSDSGIDGER